MRPRPPRRSHPRGRRASRTPRAHRPRPRHYHRGVVQDGPVAAARAARPGLHQPGREVRGDVDDLGGAAAGGVRPRSIGFTSTMGAGPSRSTSTICVPPRISCGARVGLRTSVALLISAPNPSGLEPAGDVPPRVGRREQHQVGGVLTDEARHHVGVRPRRVVEAGSSQANTRPAPSPPSCPAVADAPDPRAIRSTASPSARAFVRSSPVPALSDLPSCSAATHTRRHGQITLRFDERIGDACDRVVARVRSLRPSLVGAASHGRHAL